MQRGEYGDVPQKVGGTHRDTTAFVDEPPANGKLTKVCLYHAEFCCGLQTVYQTADGDEITTNARRGHHCRNQSEVWLELQEGEDIQLVSGRAGDIIDHLSLHTNFGRTISAGRSQGGDPFQFEGSKPVVGFLGGYGGHLHNIVPLRDNLAEMEEQTFEVGPIWGQYEADEKANAWIETNKASEGWTFTGVWWSENGTSYCKYKRPLQEFDDWKAYQDLKCYVCGDKSTDNDLMCRQANEPKRNDEFCRDDVMVLCKKDYDVERHQSRKLFWDPRQHVESEDEEEMDEDEWRHWTSPAEIQLQLDDKLMELQDKYPIEYKPDWHYDDNDPSDNEYGPDGGQFVWEQETLVGRAKADVIAQTNDLINAAESLQDLAVKIRQAFEDFVKDHWLDDWWSGWYYFDMSDLDCEDDLIALIEEISDVFRLNQEHQTLQEH